MPTKESRKSIDHNQPLNPTTSSAINSLNRASTPLSSPSAKTSNLKTPNGTIRSVPAESLQLEISAEEEGEEEVSRSHTISDFKAHTKAEKGYGSLSPLSSPAFPQGRPGNLPVPNGIMRQISSEFGPTKSYASNNQQAAEEGSNGNDGTNVSDPQWSSAVGRANLGKSGRVIEKLMTENDMLKRDINIERMRAEEAQEAGKMVELRMEAMRAEFEGRLHDATINSTLLKRRERQLEDAKAQVDLEKIQKEKALEREKSWKSILEQNEVDCQMKIQEAQMLAQLEAGRSSTMASHWKGQRDMLDNAAAELRREIAKIVSERKSDDARMNTLQTLCDQQAEQIALAQTTNEIIRAAHEGYKLAQEEGLKDIKSSTTAHQSANEKVLKESQKVLQELKWALQVHKNVDFDREPGSSSSSSSRNDSDGGTTASEDSAE